MHPKQDVFPSKAEWSKFVSELFDLLTEVKDSRQSINYWNDFRQTSTLGQFLTGLRLYSTGRIPRGIRFSKGSWYSPEDARQALIELINNKTAKYQTLKQERGLDELYLAIYYNRAILWNTPYEGINGGIEVAVEQAREQMSLDHGLFDKVFLFLAFEPDMEVFTLWP